MTSKGNLVPSTILGIYSNLHSSPSDFFCSCSPSSKHPRRLSHPIGLSIYPSTPRIINSNLTHNRTPKIPIIPSRQPRCIYGGLLVSLHAFSHDHRDCEYREKVNGKSCNLIEASQLPITYSSLYSIRSSCRQNYGIRSSLK